MRKISDMVEEIKKDICLRHISYVCKFSYFIGFRLIFPAILIRQPDA
jgi:hypothetical protein